MVRRVRAIPKTGRKPIFIRAWREYKGDMSQEKLAERLLEEAGYEISPGQLSRVERGDSPYNQDLLEALATVFGCEVADIIRRDPNVPDAPRNPLERLKPVDRQRFERMIDAYAAEDEGTGTEG